LRVLFTNRWVVDGAEEDGFARLGRRISSAPAPMLTNARTVYAIRSPLGSEERGVACPRVVVGDAAQMASI
jgi:hypothetical protein